MKIALAYLENGLTESGLTFRHCTSDPLGLRYLAGSLAKSSNNVSVHLQGDKTLEKIAQEIIAESPDAVGISCLTFNIPISQTLAAKIKDYSKTIKIIFGGEHPSLSPETTFTKNIDFIVKGEGEITLNELLDNKFSPAGIKGLYYLKNGKIEYMGDREPAEINSLAWPIRDSEIVKLTRMNSFMYPLPDKQTGLVTLLGSRGCSFDCIFCSSHELWGNKTRFRNVVDIADEIDESYKQTSANVGVFYDLTFNVNSKWVSDLCEEMIKRNIRDKMSFYSTCRVSSPNGKLILTKDLLSKMKFAGFTKIGIGIESVDELIAGEYKSGQSPWGNTLEAVNNAHDLGILVRGFLIIGGPDETPKTYEETKRKLDLIPLHDLRVGFLTPFPGTSLDLQYSSEKRYTNDISQYDCSKPIIKNSNFTYEQLVSMERDLLKHFHNPNYRDPIILDIIKREPKLKDSSKWRKKDLERKELISI